MGPGGIVAAIEMGSRKFSSPSEQHLERIALEFGSQENERDTTMKTTTKNTGIKVTASVKAGGFFLPGNHNRGGLAVKTSLKAGTSYHLNHNRVCRGGLKVKTSVKAGTSYHLNHNRRLARA